MYAYHDDGTVTGGNVGGEVLLSDTSTVDTSGDGIGSSGVLNIIAGKKVSGTAITTGTITANGGIGITNGQPVGSYDFDVAGAISVEPNATFDGPGNIVINGNVSSTALIRFAGGGNVYRNNPDLAVLSNW
jgi:hypothetical protein